MAQRKRSRPSARMQERLEETLGPRYRLVRFLGAGADSFVYKVADSCAGGEIKAAKLIDLESVADPAGRIRQLSTEFQLASRLEHPNLIRYYDLEMGADRSCAAFLMEFVAGTPWLPQRRGRSWRQICGLMVQLLRGIGFLHELGFVHGDIKPANVLCARKRGGACVRLLDYHLVSGMDRSSDGKARGTLRYMAPEVIAGKAPDVPSDLYSAGVLFYEGLTGSCFSEGTPREVAGKHLIGPATGMERLASLAEGRLCQILQRLLAKRPGARYQNAGEVITALVDVAALAEPPETMETLLARVQSTPLIGREEPLAAFEQFLCGGSARVFVIQAREGAGKTRLLRECGARAQIEGWRTLSAGTKATASALLSALEQQVGALPAPAQEAGDTAAGAEEASAWPGHLTLSKSTGPGLASIPPTLLARLDGLCTTLCQQAERRPLLLMLDDLGRLDKTGLETLAFLIRGTVKCQVFLCATTSGEEESSAPAAVWLSGWDQAKMLCKTDLGELSKKHRHDLLRAMLPPAASDDTVRLLTEHTIGSPAVLTTVVRHLVATGRVHVAVDGFMEVASDLASSAPGEMQRVAAALSRSLHGKAREAAELLAVAEQELRLAMLADMVGITPARLQADLQADPAGNVLSFAPSGSGTLCGFRHGIYATVILESIPPTRRKELNDRVADALEGWAGDDNPEIVLSVAFHRLHGVSPSRGVPLATKALRGYPEADGAERQLQVARMALAQASGVDEKELLELTGDLNLRRCAFDKAIDCYAKATEIGQGPDPAILYKIGTAYALADRYEDAKEWFEQLRTREEGQEPGSAAGYAELGLAVVGLRSLNWDQASANATCALRVADKGGDVRLMGLAEKALGVALFYTGRVLESRRALKRALPRLYTVGDLTEAGDTLALLGYAALSQQSWAEATRCLKGAVNLLRRTGSLFEAARASSALGSLHHKHRDWTEAGAWYGEALQLYRALGYNRGEAAVLINLAQLHAARGQLQESVEMASEALVTAGDGLRLRCWALLRLGQARYALGDPAGAERVAREALALAGQFEGEGATEVAHRLLGEICRLQGDLPAAEDELRKALALAEGQGRAEREAVCLARLAEVLESAGDLDSAAAHAESAVTKAEVVGAESVKALTLAVRGEVAVARGRHRTALEDLLKAHSTFEEQDVPGGLTDVAHHLAEAYLSLGKRRFAAFYLRCAIDGVEQMAASISDRNLRRLFLSDPRRVQLFEAIHAFRVLTESKERGEAILS